MDAGRFDQLVTIQQRVSAVNALGEDAYTFATLAADVWARVEPLRGREFHAAAQAQAEVTARFVIRYREDVNATMRIVWRGANYDIASPPIDPNGAKVVLELMCVNGVRDGR